MSQGAAPRELSIIRMPSKNTQSTDAKKIKLDESHFVSVIASKCDYRIDKIGNERMKGLNKLHRF